MNSDILFFFSRDPAALPLYEAFAARTLEAVDNMTVRVQKTQITFTNPRVFAAVSFLPVRKKAGRPEHYITVTLGLNRRLDSPRVDASSEPYPGRWTHHVAVTAEEELDAELLGWLREAWDFSRTKGRRGP